MFLDFLMPLKNGINVVNELKSFFKTLNRQHESIKIVQPEYIMLTAFKTPQFSNHLKS